MFGQNSQERKDTYDFEGHNEAKSARMDSILDAVVDIREFDVNFEQRVAIDNGCRVGKWYQVCGIKGTQGVELKACEKEERPRIKTLGASFFGQPLPVFHWILPVVCLIFGQNSPAYDIECTKAPLKFPVAEVDQVMMISYMIDGQGYLIINREIVSEDIKDFEYTPKPEYPGGAFHGLFTGFSRDFLRLFFFLVPLKSYFSAGPFKIFNEKNEADTLQRFVANVTPFSLPFVGIFTDFWPKFAVIARFGQLLPHFL
jgi:DNA polymerase elongation subunit (family B)